MNIRRVTVGAAFLAFSLACLQADPRDGEIVRGRNFEGVIFTPEMMNSDQLAPGIKEQAPFWTPSRALVMKAEAALPAAIADRTRYPKPVRPAGYPTYYSAKNAGRPPFSDRPEPPFKDSEFEDNFLYETKDSYADEQRQYIGVTRSGKRLLMMNFIPGDDPFTQSSWRHEWITVLGGYGIFWRVLYDPATGQFSDWIA